MNATETNQPDASQPAGTSQAADSGQAADTGQAASHQPQPLYRPLEGRMVAGVAAGIARYLGVDVTIIRIAFVVLTVIGGAGLPLYLAGWLLMPEEGSDQSIAGDFVHSRSPRRI